MAWDPSVHVSGWEICLSAEMRGCGGLLCLLTPLSATCAFSFVHVPQFSRSESCAQLPQSFCFRCHSVRHGLIKCKTRRLFLPLMPISEEAVLGPALSSCLRQVTQRPVSELGLRRRSPGTRTKSRAGFSAAKSPGNERENTRPSGTGVVRRMVLCWAALEGRDTASIWREVKSVRESKVKVKVTQLCLTLWDLMDYTVHGILQAKILEWVAFPFSRGSSQPRDQTQVSHTAGGFFTSWPTRETQECWSG